MLEIPSVALPCEYVFRNINVAISLIICASLNDCNMKNDNLDIMKRFLSCSCDLQLTFLKLFFMDFA